MKRTLFAISFATFVMLTEANSVEAGLLKIQKDGTIEVKVLAAQDEITLSPPKHEDLEVKKISDSQVSGYSSVTIAKVNDKINLEISNGVETKKMDVTGFKEDIIEIEERPQIKKVKIGLVNNRFSINQSGVTALSSYPLKVDSKNAEISVTTSTGEKYLSVFPYDAVATLLKSRLITNVPTKQIEITDVENKLQYRVVGERVFSIFNLYNYAVPVTADISASTGEILYIDAPGWLKVINFLFS